MTETWKPVVGYDGAYEVSPLGVVRSRRQVLKPQPAPNGVGETPGSSRLDSRARCEWSELEGGHSGCGAGSMIDPAEKRAAFERLKELAGQGRLVPEKRKKFTAKERAQVHADYDGRCRACDRLVGLTFHVDHRIPLFRGGKHERANWELLCVDCHAEKTGEEATGNAKIRRIEDRELNGPKPAQIKSRNEWPKGQKIARRVNPWGRPTS